MTENHPRKAFFCDLGHVGFDAMDGSDSRHAGS